MAKIKHNDSFTTIKEILDRASERGIFQLQDDQSQFNGKHFHINGNQLLNFGYCGYLGLEMDERLKEGAIQYIRENGLQYGVSRAYIRSKPEEELLDLLSQMYSGQKVLVQSSTSSAHIGNLPNLVSGNDAIILDQQVHFSIQTASQLCRQNGTHIEMIRHLNIEMLERRYHELKNKHEKIWYMADGVFSMYGDTTPITDLLNLSDILPQLYIYIDDAHGMSWKGKTGGGFIHHYAGVHPKLILNATMGKAFGVTGGITAFPTEEFYSKVKTFGGPLTYSHPLSPAITGAAIASARLHLSPEFESIQQDLADRIHYCHSILSKAGLPLLSDPETPIFYIGLGQPKVAYSMVERIMKEGFYVNIALFPAVSIKNSGFRFSISRHNSFEDIDNLTQAIIYHYDKALAENDTLDSDVRKAFKLPIIESQNTISAEKETKTDGLKMTKYSSIKQIDKTLWNKYLADEGSFDWNGMLFMEDTFSKNPEKRDNWKFHYLHITEGGETKALTFLTETYVKDDIFSKESISQQLEQIRETQPDFFVSKTLMMGSLLTEGSHLYIDKNDAQYQQVLKLLIQTIDELQETSECANVILRDFEPDSNLSEVLFDDGFVKMDMPNANIIFQDKWNSTEDFIGKMKAKKRYHFKQDVEPFLDQFYVTKIENITEDERIKHNELFNNVRKRNLAINIFPYPEKLIENCSRDKNWEILSLNLKENDEPVATIWGYKTETAYCSIFIGLNYDYLESHKVYKQVLYRIVERANQLNYSKIFFGFSADVEKGKLGAVHIPKVAYVRANDNFSLDMMATMSQAEFAKK